MRGLYTACVVSHRWSKTPTGHGYQGTSSFVTGMFDNEDMAKMCAIKRGWEKYPSAEGWIMSEPECFMVSSGNIQAAYDALLLQREKDL